MSGLDTQTHTHTERPSLRMRAEGETSAMKTLNRRNSMQTNCNTISGCVVFRPGLLLLTVLSDNFSFVFLLCFFFFVVVLFVFFLSLSSSGFFYTILTSFVRMRV